MHDNDSNVPTLFIPVESPPTPVPSPSSSSRSLAGTVNQQARLSIIDTFLSLCTPSELHYISASISALLKRDFVRDLPVELSLRILEFVGQDDPRALCRAAAVSKYWNDLVMGELGEPIWRSMCFDCGWGLVGALGFEGLNKMKRKNKGKEPLKELEPYANLPMDPALEWLANRKRRSTLPEVEPEDTRSMLWRERFKYFYGIRQNYISRNGAKLLRSHRVSASSAESGALELVVTSLALNDDWVVVGLSNARIHIFSAKTGVLSRTLVGHTSGVWGVGLISAGGLLFEEQKTPSSGGSSPPSSPQPSPKSRHSEHVHKGDVDPERRSSFNGSQYVPLSMQVALGLNEDGEELEEPETPTEIDTSWLPSDPTNASQGWGQPNALVVSGGCDKTAKVWDVLSGYCIHTLNAHTSTIRSLRVLHHAPIAVTGSRDNNICVWNIQKGVHINTLSGHEDSVRTLDVLSRRTGRKDDNWEGIVVSGSYDSTVRVWSLPSGECTQVLRGHFSQVYCVAIMAEKDWISDSERIKVISGALDTAVRVWDATTGECLALLQGHSSLVCQLQVVPPLKTSGGEEEAILVSGRLFSYLLRYTLT
ncbi:f-box and wd repeat-containing protein [Moniliophthora roreri]|nr:f-box and wd repeat-containing protein [Moniliophthora roreri]